MKQKWRPHLRTIIIVTLGIALLLPLCGLFFFRVYENQLVRQTEGELIAQSAILAAVFRQNALAAGITPDRLGAKVKPQTRGISYASLGADPEPYSPIEPTLDLARDDILPRRADAVATPIAADPAFKALGLRILPLLLETQNITLAGFRILDPKGIVIAGKSEMDLQLGHVPEIAAALNGEFSTIMRARVSDEPPPPLYSISRGTKMRVFVAMPVIINDQVAGVIYASRTPSNIVKHMYSEKGKLVLAAFCILLGIAFLGYVVSRTLTGPLLELTDRTRRIIAGDREALKPLKHNGTLEMAELSQGLLTMAQRLQNRSDEISNFASHVSHELKSPLTAILGAAELLRDSSGDMDDKQRQRFLGNIIEDTSRLNLLVKRLMDLAKAQSQSASGANCAIIDGLNVLQSQKSLNVKVNGNSDLRVGIANFNLEAIFVNLADNAAKHGAQNVTITIDQFDGQATLQFADDGSGITEHNRPKIFEPFFTTRRDEGGTGIGLGIVRAMLHAHNGSIELKPSGTGALFLINLPLVSANKLSS